MVVGVLADLDGDRRIRHRQQAQPFLDRPRQRLGCGTARTAHCRRLRRVRPRARPDAARRVPRLVGRTTRVLGVGPRSPRGRPSRRARSSPYLRRRSSSSWRRSRTASSRSGDSSIESVEIAGRGDDVVEFGQDVVQPRRHLVERAPPVDRGQRAADCVARSLVAGERLVGGRSGVTVGCRIGEQRLLGVERASSSGSSMSAASSSSTWKRSRSISRARSRSSPPRAARAASISVRRARAARSGWRSMSPNRSSADRCVATERRLWWAC